MLYRWWIEGGNLPAATPPAVNPSTPRPAVSTRGVASTPTVTPAPILAACCPKCGNALSTKPLKWNKSRQAPMWHRLITHNSLERTGGISWNTSGAGVDDEEDVKVSKTKCLRGDWLVVAGKRSASWAQHVKGSQISSAVFTRSTHMFSAIYY